MTTAAARADRQRGIPMAMLLGLQPPAQLPDGSWPTAQLDPARISPPGNPDRSIHPKTLERVAKALARIGPAEAPPLAAATGLSRSHTLLALSVLAEYGRAKSRRLKAGRVEWAAAA